MGGLKATFDDNKRHFWDVTLFSLIEINVCFGGTYPVCDG